MAARTYGLKSVSFTMTVILKDEAGKPIDPTTVLAGEPFQVQVLDGKDEPLSTQVNLTPDRAGRYQGTVTGLGTGRYTLVAKVVGQPACGFHIIPPGQDSLQIQRQENPVVIGLLIGGGLLLLALIAGIVFYVRRKRQQREHPCKGRVVIIDERSGDYVFNVAFPSDKHRRNRLVYKGKKLGARAQALFSQIEFTCADEDDSKRGVVRARILDLEGEEVLDADLKPSRSGRSTGRKIARKNLRVYKDPLDR